VISPSSSGMLPAWLCVIGVSLALLGYVVGYLRGFVDGRATEKRETERAAEERITRLCRDVFGPRPSLIWLELNGAKNDADAAELLIHFTKVEGR
jgi:hypothetical protein